MKRNFKGLVLALVLVLVLVMLAGCGNGKTNDAAATTAPAAEVAATEAPAAEATEAPAAVEATEAPAAEAAAPALDEAIMGEWKDEMSGSMEYAFAADGTTTLTVAGTQVSAGTYTTADGKVSVVYEMAGVKAPAMEMGYKLDGGKLTLTIEGAPMVFVAK